MLQFTKLPRTSAVERGGTMPLLGLTQYFFGLVALTYKPNAGFTQTFFLENILGGTFVYLKRDLLVWPIQQVQPARDLLLQLDCMIQRKREQGS
jgi:hypothetical protein